MNKTMLREDYESPMKLNLQIFADAAASGESDGAAEGDGSEGSSGSEGDQNLNKDGQQKTYTQEELSAIAAKEKREGKASVLKGLGFKDEKSAKAELEAYTKWKAEQQTAEEKAAEALKLLQDAKTEAEKTASEAKQQLSAIKLGVNADSIDDALAIARLKVTEDKTVDQVLTEMKAQERYAGFFGASAGSGTGSDVSHSTSGKLGANLGKSLAEKNMSKQTTKSTYFTK